MPLFVVSENNGVLMMTERIWRRSAVFGQVISLIGS